MKPLSLSAPLVLWLDSEAPLSTPQADALTQAGWMFLGVETLEGLRQHAAHATAIVIRLVDDLAALHAVQQLLADAGLSIPVVCRVDRADLELAVEAAQAHACAVLADDDQRPSTWLKLHSKLAQTTASVQEPPKMRRVVFVDPISQHLLALAQKVAQADVTALLVGPTGAGKEVLARVLHEASPRARAPFVALNCAAIPENLIEDMLFGHEKGAFTGAHRDHKGVFEQAHGGTLFLDEIGEMPMHLQSKLLRVLQERQLTRLGGQSVIPVNVRFIAATNKDLRQAIQDREFREDLYYRIATFRLTLLPLRERKGDIVPLALQCLAQHAVSGRPWHITAQAQALLVQYPWPGNVRELENVMRRAMVLCPDHVLTPAHLMFDECLPSARSIEVPSPIQPTLPVLPDLPDQPTPQAVSADQEAEVGAPLATGYSAFDAMPSSAAASGAVPATAVDPTLAGVSEPTPSTLPQDLHSATRLNEHQVIMATLASTPNKTEAARRLGISPRTLRYKLAQLREMGLGLATAS